ncbi:MAG TPA: hypothetical protein VEB66_10845 [Opitutaceae bacterium]|nr:hypothetical protein [Opitutaceae bacterium]
MRAIPRSCLCFLLVAGAATAGAAREDAVTTSVFAKKAPDYRRTRGEPEYFRLVNGGMLRGTSRDRTMAAVTFEELAKAVIAQLAQQDYRPADDEHPTQLLIFVHWGRTAPFSDLTYAVARDQVMNVLNQRDTLPQEIAQAQPLRNDDGTPTSGSLMAPDLAAAERERLGDELSAGLTTLEMFNRQREEANLWNARLLGYIDEINKRNGPARWAGGGAYYDDLITDIEEPRYYVILSAYDLAQTNRDGRPKLQWVTRISIRTQGNRFDDKAVAMLAAATRYFGRDSDGLVRRYERTPVVEIGEATVVGIAPASEIEDDEPRAAEAAARRP